MELATPGIAVRHVSVARHVTDCVFVFLVSGDCCVALPRGATDLPAVCDCGTS